MVAGEVDWDGRAWDPAKHPRIPKGQPGAGRFLSMVERVKAKLQQHLDGDGDGDPFDGFSREQLRLAAKARGITLKRGASRDDIAQLLLDDLRGPRAAVPGAPRPARVSGTDLTGNGRRTQQLADHVTDHYQRQTAADKGLAVIAARQGFDGKPRTVSKAEMDTLVAGGHTEIFRGVQGHRKTAKAIHDEMRYGDAFYGHGVFGNGFYFTTVRSVAGHYADGSSGSIARAALHSSARVADYTDLAAEHRRFVAATVRPLGRRNSDIVYSDIGRYAAAQGYDAIRVPRSVTGPADYYVILNRTALTVEA